MQPTIRRFNAAAAADDQHEWSGDAGVSLLVEEGLVDAETLTDRSPPRAGWPGRLLAVGTPTEIDQHEAARNALVSNLPNFVIFPPTVNSHTHLDLTHIGSKTHDPEVGFVPWVSMIRSLRHLEPANIAASVAKGIHLNRGAGVAAIGDIAGAAAGGSGRSALVPASVLAQERMLGVSYIEFFGIGERLWRCAEWLPQVLAYFAQNEDSGGQNHALVRIGLQPHAPNTVDARVYEWASELAQGLDLPISTHVAETPEERMFVASGQGPQRKMLEDLGLWNDGVLERVGMGRSPIQHTLKALRGVSRPLFVHANDAGDADIEALGTAGAAVAYCPRASAYFGADRHFGQHRYREMIAAGVSVSLGTDSLVNLPESAGRMPSVEGEGGSAGRGMSVWDEARFLYQRDGTDAAVLVAMATTHGAAALGLNPGAFRLSVGSGIAGLAMVRLGSTASAKAAGRGGNWSVRARALESEWPMVMLWDRKSCGQARIV